MSATMLITVVNALLLAVSFVYATERTTCTQPSCEVLVRIDSGPVCGRVLDAGNGTHYYSFRGIPYGKPPVGARRFQELEFPEPWDEPLHAIVEGPACPQKDLLYGRIPIQLRGQSEDCIYTNVHVPKSTVFNNKNTVGLSIMVFIHGGAFNAGSGNSDLHGPEYLIFKNVIVITFNYRLNVFGFLSLNSPKIPGNAGLRDMVTLLRWVQRNARAFGGNPDDVTLMGHSAGSASAHLLSLSTSAQGLFKRVIMLSGTGIPNFYDASPKYAKTVADMFLEAAGINSTDPDNVFRELIHMPLTKIMYANNKVQHETGLLSFVPVVEDQFSGITRILDAEPITLIGQGRGKHFPMLVTFTNNEMEFMRENLVNLDILEQIKENPAAVLPGRIASSVSSEEALELAEKLKQRYFNGTPTIEEYMDSLFDIFFTYPIYKLAEWRTALHGGPTYLSQYSYESESSVLKEALWIDYKGATHLEDVTYLFHVNSISGPNVAYQQHNVDDQMKDWMTTLITNFMRCSNPTCMHDEVSPWPAVSKTRLQYNNNSGPMRYTMVELTPEDRDMIQFYDSIDREARNLSEYLSSYKMVTPRQ